MSGKFVNHFNSDFESGHGSKCPNVRAPDMPDTDTGHHVRCLQCGKPIGPGGREITVRSTGPGEPIASVHYDCFDEWQRRGPSQ